MAQHRVIELRRFLDPRGRALPAHAEEVSWLGTLLEILSACGIGARWERAAVRCGATGCPGPMALRRIGDACEWFCAACTASGAIVGWRGTHWDLTQVEERDEVDRSDALVFTRLDELEAVRRAELPRELRLPLAMAKAHADYVTVPFSAAELAELLCALEPATERLPVEERRLSERFVARLDAALLACEARRVELPTLH